MKNKKKNILAKKNVLIALEISPPWVKAMVSEGNDGKRRIVRFYARRVEDGGDDVIVKTLKDLFSRMNIAKAKVALSIPRSRVAVKFVKHPSVNPEEIKKMVRFQAIDELPYSPDEIIVDYSIIETDKEGYSRVMLVIVHRDTIRRDIQLLEKVNIQPEFVALSSEGSFLLLANDKNFKGALNEPTCIINIDYYSADIEVILNNNLFFSRSISLNFRNTDDAGWQENLIKEVGRSLSSFQKKAGRDIVKIILSGTQAKQESLKCILEKEFSFPVKTVQPLENVSLTAEEAVLFNSEPYSLLSFQGVSGVALYGDRLKINLLPKELKAEKQRRTFRKMLIATGFLTAFLIAVGAGTFLEKLYYKRLYLEKLEEKLQNISSRAGELEYMSQRLEAIKQQLAGEVSFLDTVREVYKLVPQTISLTKFNYKRGASLTLKGLSDDMSAVFRFTTVLEKSPLFKNVNIKYTSKKKLKERELTDFEIYCSLRQTNLRKDK